MTTIIPEPLRAFHGRREVKDKLLARIAAHEEADAIIHGAYWEKDDGGKYRGCAVGCSLHEPGQKRLGRNLHSLYPKRLGLPEWLARLEDRLFENMPAEKSLTWPRRFAEAIPVGADFDGLADRLAIRRLSDECLPLSDRWLEPIRADVVAAIERVIAALEGKGDRKVAEEAAAWSAEAAAWSAAASAWSAAASAAASAWSAEEAAAWSAAASAWSAAASAASAEGAAWSAEAAARSAAHDREADRLIAELRALPVPGDVDRPFGAAR